jgi:hypothetical protein
MLRRLAALQHTLLFQYVRTNGRRWVEFNNGANFKNLFSCPNKKQSFCALMHKCTHKWESEKTQISSQTAVELYSKTKKKLNMVN